MTKVLVVDDDRKIRYLLVEILSDAGCEVIEAADGGVALETAIRELPDLIFLDISMPVLDGFEFVRRLREIPAARTTPVIVVTTLPSVEGELTSWKLGIKHYITKPFSAKHVNMVLRVAIRETEDGPNQRSDETGQQKDATELQQQAIRTGIWQLDHALDGGIPPGSLTFISGTPSSGKSIFCQHVAYEALRAGHGVAYLLANDTNDSLIGQMTSIGMDVLGYLQADKFRVCPITRALDDNCEMAEQSEQSMRTLASQIQGLPNQLKVTVVDDITDCATDSTDRALLRFFANCKRLTKDGRTIIVVSQSYAFDEGFTARLRDVCDAHLIMQYEMFSERPILTLEVAKIRGAVLNVPTSISFIVEPGIGINSVPFGKFKV